MYDTWLYVLIASNVQVHSFYSVYRDTKLKHHVKHHSGNVLEPISTCILIGQCTEFAFCQLRWYLNYLQCYAANWIQSFYLSSIMDISCPLCVVCLDSTLRLQLHCRERRLKVDLYDIVWYMWILSARREGVNQVKSFLHHLQGYRKVKSMQHSWAYAMIGHCINFKVSWRSSSIK